MMIGFLAFGFLCGVTAAVLTFTAGAGLLAALLAYAVVGAAGMLLCALPGWWELSGGLRHVREK